MERVYIVLCGLLLIEKYKRGNNEFIFTLKNPHGVEPTCFGRKIESRYGSYCNPKYGPVFCGDKYALDIFVGDYCNREDSCWIENDENSAYKCHSDYKRSLFVNTDGPDKRNKFIVLDYEVYTSEISKDYVYIICKYPAIMWNYIQTNDISEELLKEINDDTELRNDFDLICCDDKRILMKVSRYCLKNPSELLPNTTIVDKQYDSYLREWLGNEYEWKLLYRASEHEYTAKSFHYICDFIKPTLVIIKSTEGWIFGGYATHTWDKYGMYNMVLIIL